MSVRMVARWAGAALVGAGVAWLGPLMLDQFVLFGPPPTRCSRSSPTG